MLNKLNLEISNIKDKLVEIEEYINRYATKYARSIGYVAEREEEAQKLREKLQLLEQAQELLQRAYSIN